MAFNCNCISISTFCPFSEEYAIFLDRLESDLLAGDIKSISATVATRQELDSWIRGQYRILAFSVDGIEYLSVESTKKHLIKNDIGAFFAFLLYGILPLVSLLFEFHLLGIIKYQKTRKRNKGKEGVRCGATRFLGNWSRVS